MPDQPKETRETINFVSFREDVDGTPLLKGLPDDRCQCPHWGYVLKGKLTYRFADHEEVFEAGDAFYLPPGHLPLAEAGSELVQFSPSDELRAVEEAMTKNMQESRAPEPTHLMSQTPNGKRSEDFPEAAS